MLRFCRSTRARTSSLLMIGALLQSSCGLDSGAEQETRAEASSGSTAEFALRVRNWELCGSTYSSIVAEVDDPSLVVEEAVVPIEGTDQAIVMPAAFRPAGSPSASHEIVYRGDELPRIEHPLLPRPPPLSTEAAEIDRYCDYVHRFLSALQESGPALAETPLLALELGEEEPARIADVSVELPLAPEAPAAPVPVEELEQQPAAGGVQYLIIHSHGYEGPAEELRQDREQKGLRSLVLGTHTLPGTHPGDPVPFDCEGAYLQECFFSAGDPIVGIDPASVPALFGMLNQIPLGAYAQRIPDLAGLIRASIRRIKRENPGLRYVVLLGDPAGLPPRFTGRDAYGQQAGRVFTLPSDFYFRELHRPWSPTGRVNYAPSSELVWPCGLTICPEPNSDWDTTHFVWPVSFPFARTFLDPFAPGSGAYTEDELASMVSVGRIHGKTPGDVASYIWKLKAWEARPRALLGTAIVSDADAVYDKSHLSSVKQSLGSFHFFGEGFGSGYLTENVPADCMSSRPPINSWEATGWNAMWQYQQQDDHCKPDDPSLPGFKLPAPQEVIGFAAAHGFSFFLMQGHGSSRTVGLNTNQFNKRKRRQFSAPLPPNPSDPDHENRWIEGMQWSSSVGNGFLVSSACDPGEFLGGHTATSVMKRERTLAEYFVAMEQGGGIGAYMNYLEGWYGGDPSFDMHFLAAVRSVHDQASNRIGDAVTAHLKSSILGGYASRYQILNRTYFGDPSATIASKRSIVREEDQR